MSTSHIRNFEATKASRAIPLTGSLALGIGATLLFAYWKFRGLFADWELSHLAFFLVVCGILVFYGISRLLPMWLPASENRGRFVYRHRVLLPQAGIVYLVVMSAMLVGSLLGHSNMLMLIFSMMAGPFILNGWVTFTLLGRNNLRRTVPQRMMAGDTVSVELELHNAKRLFASWVMVVRDSISNGREKLDPAVLFARVGPKQKNAGYYQMRLTQRGVYQFGPMELATRFPLGVVERGLIYPQSDRIVVYPRIGELTADWKRQRRLRQEIEERTVGKHGNFDDEFHGLREYRSGDNPRSIHWRTSARRSELMVREFSQNRIQHLVVLVDLWMPMKPTPDDRKRVELALSFAATLSTEHSHGHLNSRLAIGIAGRRHVFREHHTSLAQLEFALDDLATAEASTHPQLHQLMEAYQSSGMAASQVVLITTRRKNTNHSVKEWDELAPYLYPGFEVVESSPEQLESILILNW